MIIDLELLLGGCRRTLARAITLVESNTRRDRELAKGLTGELLPQTGRSIRLGISGAPGVGKSTFIDALGMHLIDLGHKPAVLAIDPSSPVSGGSILGDKVRMQRLASAPGAYVRPTPSGGQLGGVASRTREAILICEAAGFDVILVETVGVGQSEVSVAGMVDLFVILLQPDSGDEVQGVKRGILDLVDLAIVNKADGAQKTAAERTAGHYRSAFSLTRRDATKTHVLPCSALHGTGVGEIWRTLQAEVDTRKNEGLFECKRAEQCVDAMEEEFQAILIEELASNPTFSGLRHTLRTKVAEGEMASSAAAKILAEQFLGGLHVPQATTTED